MKGQWHQSKALALITDGVISGLWMSPLQFCCLKSSSLFHLLIIQDLHRDVCWWLPRKGLYVNRQPGFDLQPSCVLLNSSSLPLSGSMLLHHFLAGMLTLQLL